MFSRAIALVLSLTLLWSGAAMAGQAAWEQLARSGLSLSGPGVSQRTALAPSPQRLTQAALAAAPSGPSALDQSGLLAGGPESGAPVAEDFASPLHAETLPDVVALLDLRLRHLGAAWRSPRPQPLSEALPRAPHLEGLRRPPRLGWAAA